MVGDMACDNPQHAMGGWEGNDLVSSQPPHWDPSPLLAAIVIGVTLALLVIKFAGMRCGICG